MGNKNTPNVQIVHRIMSIRFLFFITWFWFTLVIVILRYVYVNEELSIAQVWVNPETSLDDLTYPEQPVNSYWDIWMNQIHTADKTVWFDNTGDHATRTEQGGWVVVESPEEAIGRAFKLNEKKDLDHLAENFLLHKPVAKENAKNLYFVPPNASFIYSRIYYYQDKDGPTQTARLGIDYACPGQMMNHVPGASAFCRKDYMQMYLKAYQDKYRQDGNPQWFKYVTPKSYILTEQDHCEEYLNELTELLAGAEGKELPLTFIHKNSVMHQGKGIEFVDYEKGSELLEKYQGSDRCARLAEDNEDMIAQQYIYNPALIEKRKFDMRMFMVIANVNPLVVLWAPENGHIRLSDQEFDVLSSNFTAHITADVHGATEEERAFLLDYRGLNLRELGDHFKDKIGNTQEWLDNVALPRIQSLIIHAIRASQQNFVVQRPGLFEMYGVDLIMEDNLQEIWLLETNRRPRVEEENERIKYRKFDLLDDFTRIADYLFINGVTEFNPDKIYPLLKCLVPLIDETKEDPYFGMLSKEWQNINVKDYDGQLPLDPMLAPLVHHLNKKSSEEKEFLK